MSATVTRALLRPALSASASPTARRIVIGVTGGLALACAAVAVGYGESLSQTALILATWSVPYLVAGAIGWTRRPTNATGPLLLLIGLLGAVILLGAVPELGPVSQLSAVTATVLLFLILLISPAGRFSDRSDAAGFVVLAAGFAAIVLLRDLIPGPAQPLGLAAICTGLLALVLRRWQRASGPTRRSLAPIALAGTITVAVFLANILSTMLGIANDAGSIVFVFDAIGRALIPFGFLAGLLRLRMARIAVADLVTQLGELPHPDRLREALSTALGDPSLEVGYWSAAEQAHVGGDGRVLDLPAEASRRAVTRLERNGLPVAAILHDPALDEDPGLVASVAAAVRLAVENEGLTARVESQLQEVRASRARIVAAGDAERKRVERDLHDGAQQRLVALTLALRLARNRLGDDTDPQVRVALEQAADDAAAALAELRELARGLHPLILSQSGLAAAVDSLAALSAVDVTVDISAGDRYPAPVESAAYFVVSEALANVAKYAHASRASVRAAWRDGRLDVEVADDGIGGADPARGTGLRGLADRLSAVDGTLEIRSPVNGGTRLLAHIPSVAPAAMPG